MTEAGDRARKAVYDLTEAIEQMVKDAGGETAPAMVTMMVTQLESLIGLMELKPSRTQLE